MTVKDTPNICKKWLADLAGRYFLYVRFVFKFNDDVNLNISRTRDIIKMKFKKGRQNV